MGFSRIAVFVYLIYLFIKTSFSIYWVSSNPIKIDQSSLMFFLKPAFKHLSMALESSLPLSYANTFLHYCKPAC